MQAVAACETWSTAQWDLWRAIAIQRLNADKDMIGTPSSPYANLKRSEQMKQKRKTIISEAFIFA